MSISLAHRRMLTRSPRQMALCLLLLCLSCSSSKTIRIVDAQGRPVEGAVVVSEQGPYILQRWKYAAVVTDSTGRARVVDYKGHVFHEDYHPIINASELDDGLYWSPPTQFRPTTTIYRKRSPGAVPVEVSYRTIRKEGAERVYPVELSECNDAVVTYDIGSSRIAASSDVEDLIGSRRFYFERGDPEARVRRIAKKDRIAFYCESPGGRTKVGIATTAKGALEGQETHELVVLVAPHVTTGTYIEPTVKCPTESNLYGIRGLSGSDSRPRVFVTGDLQQRVADLRKRIECFDEYADRLFPYPGAP